MNETNVKSKKIENKKKLSVRDYITMALMLVLILVVYSIIGIPLSMTVVGNIFMHAACSLVWGTVFLLLFVRINKKWLPLSFGIILGLLQIFNMWITTVFIIVGAVIAEWIWQKWDKESFKTMTASFSVQITFWYLGNFVPLILIGNLEGFISERYLQLYMGIKEAVNGPLFFIGLIAVIGCTIIGAFIGRRLLKKHFEKAGVV